MEGLYNWGGPVSFDLWQRVCRLCAVSRWLEERAGAKSLSKVKMLFGKGRLHNDRQDAVGQIRKLICFWWIYKIWVRYEPTF